MTHKNKKGWHGTTTKAAEIIKDQGFELTPYKFNFNKSRIPNDLGNGVYFYLEDDILDNPKEVAYKYVKIYKSDIMKDENSSPKVLGATIKFPDANFLDMDERDNMSALIAIKKQMEREVYSQVQKLYPDGAFRRGNLDGLFIELLIEKFKRDKNIDIQIVTKYTFTNLQEKIGNFKINISNFPNAREVSVRKLDLIEDLS